MKPQLLLSSLAKAPTTAVYLALRCVLTTFVLSLTLNACGQKGPLYLPEKPVAAPTAPASGSGKTASASNSTNSTSASSATADTSKDKTQR